MRKKNIFIICLALFMLISTIVGIVGCSSTPQYGNTEEVIQTTTTTTEKPIVREKQTTTTTTIQSD